MPFSANLTTLLLPGTPPGRLGGRREADLPALWNLCSLRPRPRRPVLASAGQDLLLRRCVQVRGPV
jgi:hypothetical protein